MSFQTDRFGGLALHHDGVDARAYASLELWLNGGRTGGQRVVIGVWDGARLRYVDLTALLGRTLRANTWERALIPVASLTASGMVRDLFIVSLESRRDGPTIYVDDVRLVP
jgi:hypothetical protein